MKAVILAGGEGTRLRPLTCNTPKPMVPVLNRPFLEYVLYRLRACGITDITLALSHLPQSIENHFGDGSRFEVSLSYTVEDTPLGTAGAVKMAEKHLDGPFVVLNGDIFTDLDIKAMIELHRERKATATIALTPVDDPTSYGLIETTAEERITRFVEKPSREQITTNMINAGVYILEPDTLEYIPPQTKWSFEREFFPLLLKESKPVYAHPSATYWIDMGTPEKYLQLNIDLLTGRSTQSSHPSGDEVEIGEKTVIHHTAQIKGPVLIGNNCTISRGAKITGPAVIGPGANVMEDAVIEASVIWRDALIRPRVNLRNSIMANNGCLDKESTVDGSVLGDKVTVTSGTRLKPGSKIQPGTVVSADT